MQNGEGNDCCQPTLVRRGFFVLVWQVITECWNWGSFEGHLEAGCKKSTSCIIVLYCIVSSFILKHGWQAFTISLCNTFMQKVRVETSYRNKSNCYVCAEKHKAGEKVSIVTNWKVERVGSRAEVILDGRAQKSAIKTRFYYKRTLYELVWTANWGPTCIYM